MLRKPQFLLLIVLLLASVFVLQACQTQEKQVFLTIGSGPSGSAFGVAATKLAEIITREVENVSASNAPGVVVENTRKVNTAEMDMATDFGYIVDAAINGIEPFEEVQDNISIISNLYPTVFQVFARADSGIETMNDLKGKNIAVGAAGTSNDIITRRVLGEYNLTYADIENAGGSISYSMYDDAKQLMADGAIDVITVSSIMPVAIIVELQLTNDIILVKQDEEKIESFLNKYEGFGKTVIKPNTYKDQDYETQAIVNYGIIIIRKDLNEDLVYNITKAMWENQEEVQQSHAGLRDDFKIENAVKDIDVNNFHPGAKKYFIEKGLLPK